MSIVSSHQTNTSHPQSIQTPLKSLRTAPEHTPNDPKSPTKFSCKLFPIRKAIKNCTITLLYWRTLFVVTKWTDSIKRYAWLHNCSRAVHTLNRQIFMPSLFSFQIHIYFLLTKITFKAPLLRRNEHHALSVSKDFLRRVPASSDAPPHAFSHFVQYLPDGLYGRQHLQVENNTILN